VRWRKVVAEYIGLAEEVRKISDGPYLLLIG
jgi:hypothetical protein